MVALPRTQTRRFPTPCATSWAFREAHSRPNPAASLSLRVAGEYAQRPFRLDLIVRRPLIRMTTGELVSDLPMGDLVSVTELQHLELTHSVHSSSSLKAPVIKFLGVCYDKLVPLNWIPWADSERAPHFLLIYLQHQNFSNGLKNFGFLDTTFKLG